MFNVTFLLHKTDCCAALSHFAILLQTQITKLRISMRKSKKALFSLFFLSTIYATSYSAFFLKKLYDICQEYCYTIPSQKLERAILVNDLAQVESALRDGAKVNSALPASRTLPLHLSVKLRHHSIINALLANKASPHMEDEKKLSALSHAIPDAPTIRTLLQAGALVEESDIIKAQKSGCPEIIKLLRDAYEKSNLEIIISTPPEKDGHL